MNNRGEPTMNPVIHFEMPYDDRQRMAAFYEAAFGWQTNALGEPMDIPGVGPYVSFFDTEGNRVSLLQPLPRSGQAPD
jgi:predicted enzyme related to lactoylglutathione lyase